LSLRRPTYTHHHSTTGSGKQHVGGLRHMRHGAWSTNVAGSLPGQQFNPSNLVPQGGMKTFMYRCRKTHCYTNEFRALARNRKARKLGWQAVSALKNCSGRLNSSCAVYCSMSSRVQATGGIPCNIFSPLNPTTQRNGVLLGGNRRRFFLSSRGCSIAFDGEGVHVATDEMRV